MKEQAGQVDILVVDDTADKLLALRAVLEELGENVVAATSGRDALRHILRQRFAVILLDINMPDMDGFETAALVRRYRPSQHTPIIFMTASGDDMLRVRSYELGAVDYLLTPAIPEVLRSKVRVFAELHRKTGEVQRQAAALQRLAAASLTVHAAVSLDGIVQAVTDAARHVVDAHRAMTTLSIHPGSVRSAVSFSERHAAFRDLRPGRGAEALYLLARPRSGPARLTQREIEANPLLRAAAAEAEADGPPRRGFLAAPLTEQDGRSIGLIQLSDKDGGDFTEDDEALLVQLAQLGSIAIQNCLHAEAREANRLKDEFLATLSHELRTPLHAMLGWIRMLRRGPPDPARISRGLEIIERNVGLQTGLIDELLDVSRITAGKLRIERRALALGPIVEAAVDALRPAAEAKGVQLDAALGEDMAQVHGDAERLQQVFGNLIGNAIKFTQKGGQVSVTLEQQGGDVEVRVIDTGTGIGAEFLPYVFDRFRQADRSLTHAQGGLGLGLSVVRHLVELHGGTVSVESPGPGRGATFAVRLPEHVASSNLPPLPAAADAPSLRTPNDPEISPRSGVRTLDGLRVLVVDDDDDARELLREVLLQHHAEVITANSAHEALGAIDEQRPDLLVSDISMRDGDGYELIRRIRERPPQEGGGLPALALTAFARGEDRLHALEAGFHVHVAKPIEPDDLVAALAALASATEAQVG